MDFVDKNIEKYVEALSDKESPLLNIHPKMYINQICYLDTYREES